MPFVPGEDLAKRLRRKHRLSWREVTRISADVTQALAFIHAHNIVHGDVKPSNLMRLPGGRILLMDMGIANIRGTRFSLSGTFALGSPAYMPPEQIEGKPVDGRGDQYALAITLYELLAGRRPFESDSIAVVLHKQLHDPPPPLPAAGIPAPTAAAVMRALSKQPEARFPDMAAFQQALAQTASHPTPRFVNGLVFIAACAVIAALIIGLVIYVSTQGGVRPAPVLGL
jgi:serine/threonine-protein kinase